MADNSPPIIAFVGRPLDPVKGLITFLDAIERLRALPSAPEFSTWIVGGDDEEIAVINNLLKARPRLCTEARSGRLMVWGKVQRQALPELYRRSLVVGMPSLREQFGLVALEAMACGVPVIGTKQGGLDDIILAGITGAKAEIDQPDAIAGAILLYLRGPVIRRVRGIHARVWVQNSFEKSVVYGHMADLYTKPLPPQLDVAQWDLPDRFHAREVEGRLNSAEALLGERITNWSVVAARYHVVARMETATATYAVKIFRDRPSLSAAMLPAGICFPDRTAQDFVDNATYHAANPLAPVYVGADREAGIAAFAWHDATAQRLDANSLKLIRSELTAFGDKGSAHAAEFADYEAAVKDVLVSKNETSLRVLDHVSVALNRARQGVSFGQRLTHPAAELLRISICQEEQGWPIPPDIESRIRMVVNRLTAQPTNIALQPKLCHGDLQGRHVFNDGKHLRLFDTEHSTFAVGELDLGTFATAELARGVNMGNVLGLLREATTSREEVWSALQWTAYFLILRYLARVHHGQISESGLFLRRALYDLALVLS